MLSDVHESSAHVGIIKHYEIGLMLTIVNLQTGSHDRPGATLVFIRTLVRQAAAVASRRWLLIPSFELQRARCIKKNPKQA